VITMLPSSNGPFHILFKSMSVLWNFEYFDLRVKKMKACIAAIVIVIALISAALATNLTSDNIQNCGINSSQQTNVSPPSNVVALGDEPSASLSGSLLGTTDVSFGFVAQEVITTAFLLIGSIAVLKKKK
jgi:hypothetical protein